MIGMKDQYFGVEVEMTGITREQAATALAAYFATDARYVGGAYDKWCVTDRDGKEWTVMSDSSIHGEQKIGSGYRATGDYRYRVEMVSFPKQSSTRGCMISTNLRKNGASALAQVALKPPLVPCNL